MRTARSAKVVDVVLQQYYQHGIIVAFESIVPLFLTVGCVLDRTTIFPQCLLYSSSQSVHRFWHIGLYDIPRGYTKSRVCTIHTGHKTEAMSIRPCMHLRFGRSHQSTNAFDPVRSSDAQGGIRLHRWGMELPSSKMKDGSRKRKQYGHFSRQTASNLYLSQTHSKSHRNLIVFGRMCHFLQ